MQKDIEEAIYSLIKAFNAQFDDFHGIYLYGLFIDGQKHKDEDVELVALFDTENKYKREIIWPILGKIETDLHVCIDLHPISMDDFKNDEELYSEIIQTGIFFDVNCVKK